MKKLLLLLLASAGAWAQGTAKFTAEIKNPNSDELTINSEGIKNSIKATAPGKFSGSVDVKEAGFYELNDGAEYAVLYLKDGFDLKMTLDAKEFDETITFTGKGAKENNLLAQRMMSNEALQTYFDNIKTADEATAKIDESYKKLVAAANDPEVDPGFKDIIVKQLEVDKQQLAAVAQTTVAANQMKGKPSPKFNLENHKGGTTSLDSFKGKYVYIDVWATWCGPCRREIPFLKQIEEKYHGKNIEFVSISIDEKKDHEKWKKFVETQQLGGVQLFAENAWQSAFTQAYGIDSIPRFILIDPTGNVVDSNAKRPSDPALQEQLDKLVK
ncbi:thioredoxin [Flavobacterium akiainvivens]|uniref:Thioredoxin n=1 Tax=Flavobacterium akiainvivens TaxID=1202724 RepID=A0A0M8MJA3_9FLAO|nr:TlpA disulfide reductase family protein [Flavobacterium akiainvivens]KOS07361.1 thioredoxin [Flavobacterium akiainvivens]SFQ47182.1 Thiol-disulfide isomerase or thioredoxin [Flavobacterium akiainvivens]